MQPPAELASRFAAAINHLISQPTSDQKIGLAVSGGPDSLALLLLAHAAFPDRIVAATVDHQLRPEAADEAICVASLCAHMNVPHSILVPQSPITGNLQSSARAVRYALLDAWATAQQCDWIATAHHGEDQIETILMRLMRGSGVDGLSGIRAINGRIIRPLLDFSKAELEYICAAAPVTPVRDPSNADDHFDRVRLRQWLAASHHPFEPAAANRSAQALNEASTALEWMTDTLAGTHIKCTEHGISIDPAGLPGEIQRRLLLRGLRMLDTAAAPRGDAISHSLSQLRAGQNASLGNFLCKGGDLWQITEAPVRRTG